MINRLRWLALAALACWMPAGMAEESSAEVRYVELQPTFITNFGEPGTGRPKYLKTEVSVRVGSLAGETAARYHLPALRNSLVLLLSRQDEAAVSSSSGREVLRVEALAEIRSILEAEEGEAFVEDLMFTNFIVQP